MFVSSLIDIKAIRVNGTKRQRLKIPKRREGELQFRQIRGYLAGEWRTELIEVRAAGQDSVNEMSKCGLAASGRGLALNLR